MNAKQNDMRVTPGKGKFYVSFLAKAQAVGYVPVYGPYNTKQEAENKLNEVTCGNR